ncbi:putative glucose-1-phosphate adenylyltransferase [Medicago truncatula]|uniref:Glucose-1-phosphate adenylyltransferase, putative n=1 Tax=Medicago truncatula TaxID=3880 RepID=A0A072UX42_MEDTR|nr:glucose-1-phosphate adenylyltransferase, putative [Medicago truncatula]RHN67318.1 putative glucose-1-phosphate adenylyltransferase [Medicago truncatula]
MMATGKTLVSLRLSIMQISESPNSMYLTSVYTQLRYLPPSKMLDADITDSVIGEGFAIKKIEVCTSLTSLPIQSLERFSLLFRRENQMLFLLEDQSS